MPGPTFTLALERFTSFGDLLKFLRRRAGLTQRELSIQVGYSHAQISRLELNQRPPDLATVMARFVEALDLEHEPEVAARLLDLAAAGPRQAAPAAGAPPFKGLRWFDEADAELFFGREALTARLFDRLRASLSLSTDLRFLAIVGASGSGKSSLVRAGLIPAVRQSQEFTAGGLRSLTPTARPLEALAAALHPEPASPTSRAVMVDDLHRDSHALLHAAARLLAAEKAGAPTSGSRTPARLLIVVDQFEELFTLCQSEAERRAFIENLTAAVSEPGGPTFLVLTLRADFYDHCAPYADLRQALALRQEFIGPMSPDELRRAIEGPAQHGGWELEPGLVDLLLQDVGAEAGRLLEPGALPMLSHSLLETWQRRRGRTLTVSGYLASGGVRGAIAETADVVFHDQLDPAQQGIARSIFLRLTHLGDDDGSAATRRRSTIDELIRRPEDGPAVREVLTRLADARLIITDEGVAEVAHEALIREWPTLRGWLQEDRQGLLLHQHLTRAAEAWERRGRDSSELYRGGRLAHALGWAAANPGELSEPEQTFLDESRTFAEREETEREAQRQRELHAAQALAETQRRAASQLRRRALYLLGAFVLATLMAGVALVQGDQVRRAALTAQGERRVATARELSAAALVSVAEDPERSILLALQAVSTTRAVDGSVLPEAAEALHRSVIASPVRMTLTGHDVGVLSAAYSPDGERLATVDADGTAIVWDAGSGEELRRWPGAGEPSDLVTAQRIAFSHDGNVLAVCNGRGVDVYDAAARERIRTLAGQPAPVTAVAFSRDGAYIASGTEDGTLVIWDAASGESLVQVAAHLDAVEGLTFSPDGHWLITSSDDATMKIWGAATGDLVHEYAEFTGVVDSVAFSPDGSQFAFTTVDGLHLWQLEIRTVDGRTTVASQEVLTVPEGASATFSPDGTRLATASASAAKVWDAQTGRQVLNLVGHTDWVMGLAFSADGQQLASTSLDGTVRLWDLGPGSEVVTVLGRGAGYGTRVVYSPDGSAFATNGGDGSVTLWDAATGRGRTLRAHAQEVLSLAFSPDGSRLATGSLDASARVWDIVSGRPLLAVAGHEFGVRDVAFSPDGNRLASGGFDGTARVWDVANGNLLLEITGHDGLVLGVAFSPDGTRLATSSTDATAKIWDARSGDLLLTLAGHTSAIPDLTYSPDGLRLATGGKDTTAKLWDAATGDELLTLSGHGAEIQSVGFSPDGRLLVTGSGDNTARVWDVATGEVLITLPGSSGGVYGAAFSPLDGGAQIVVASNDGVVRVFLLRLEDLLALATSRVTRSLTQAECLRYLHLEQCPAFE